MVIVALTVVLFLFAGAMAWVARSAEKHRMEKSRQEESHKVARVVRLEPCTIEYNGILYPAKWDLYAEEDVLIQGESVALVGFQRQTAVIHALKKAA